jgi:uncharacterized protein
MSWAARGLAMCPLALADSSGSVVVIDNVDAATSERTVRAFVALAGGWAALAMRPEKACRVPHTTITGTLGRALSLGERALALRASRAGTAEFGAALGGVIPASGRVVDVTRHTSAPSYGRGTVTIATPEGAVCRVEMGNEYVIVLIDGRLAAAAPEIICILDARTLTPVSCETVAAGLEAHVLVLPGPGEQLTPDHAIALSPPAFGFPRDDPTPDLGRT